MTDNRSGTGEPGDNNLNNIQTENKDYIERDGGAQGAESGGDDGNEQDDPFAGFEDVGGQEASPSEKDGEQGNDSGEDPPPATDESEEEPGEGDPDGEGDEGGEQDRKKPKSDFQTRMDQQTAARREAERQAEESRRDAEYWRQVAMNGGKPPEEKGQAPEAEGGEDSKVREDGSPDSAKYEYGEFDPQYLADLSAYTARKTFEQLRQEEQINSARESVETSWNERVREATERHEDFEEKVTKGGSRGDWACSHTMALGIKTSDYGPDIAYHFASSPEESDRVANLPPLEQAKEMGRLEARFEAEATARTEEGAGKQQQKNEPPTASSAPKPPPRVRGSSGKFETPWDTNDFAAFEKRADKILEKH